MNSRLNYSHRRHATTWTIALAALCANLTGALNLSAAPAAASATVPGRYLLIVETSDDMRRRTEGTQKLLGELMRSGFNGQLRPGDTIGVWTFNDQLHTGVFPLQLWTPQTREKTAAGLVGFLKAQRYEKSGNLTPVLPEMASVVKDSDKITVLLVTTGADKIRGTPFDAEINDTYALNQSVQEKARLPYVTILRAVKGEFSGFTVNTPPWPVEFPKFSPPPATPKPVAAVPSPAADAEKEQQRLAALRRTLEGGTVISATGTVSVTTLSDGTAAANKQATQSAAPSPALPASTPATLSSTPPNPVPEPPAPISNANVAAPAPIPVAVEPSPAVFKVVTETKATPPPQPKPVAPVVASPPSRPKPAPTAAVPLPVQPAPTGVETPAEHTLPRSVILIAGTALVLVALALLVVLLRRPTRRPPERISLITRSLDKEKK
jgi:hypothetical protein